MIWLSIAITLSVAICGHVALKFIELQYAKLDVSKHINIEAANVALSAPINEKFNTFDDRINKTWGTVSSIKEELNALRMQLALGKKNG